MKSKRNELKVLILSVALALTAVLVPVVSAQDNEATRLLKARTAEFDREVIKVTDGVYTAVGYSVQPVSMIVGNDGLIIVDTGIDTTSAEQVLADFRKITDKPIKAIVLTHSHGDHTGGVPVFVGQGAPPIWARSNFGSESDPLNAAGLTFNNVRGARQGGFKLPPEKRINNGVAQAYWPKRGGAIFHSDDKVGPTHTFSEPRRRLEIAGVKLELVAVNAETADALYLWLPEKRVLFSGDNFYKSWPNLYAIRGTMYRDVRSWADAIDMMLQEGPDYLVPGHTRPVIGKAKIAEMLTDYRDAIRFVFDKTIEGMNKGLTPDELVDYVKLPERFAGKDYLREYYGNVQWAVRQIFNAHLGWFDGNPTNLFSLSPREEAQHMAKLAGGRDALLAKARQALAGEDYQWAAQLSDHLLALDAAAGAPRLIKAEALEALAENLLTATGRNYYLTVAQELRKAGQQN
jgi:alkyl sulfatase BDS1-like metallo-beta-lactamase superfamily hydrolase